MAEGSHEVQEWDEPAGSKSAFRLLRNFSRPRLEAAVGGAFWWCFCCWDPTTPLLQIGRLELEPLGGGGAEL